jgi:hypothetical protein
MKDVGLAMALQQISRRANIRKGVICMKNQAENSSISDGKLTPAEILPKSPRENGASAPVEDKRFKSPDELIELMSSHKIAALNQELKDLKGHYDKEKSQWKEYEKRIQCWRTQVLEVVKDLKKQASQKQTLLAKVKHQQEIMEKQDLEIEELNKKLDRYK